MSGNLEKKKKLILWPVLENTFFHQRLALQVKKYVRIFSHSELAEPRSSTGDVFFFFFVQSILLKVPNLYTFHFDQHLTVLVNEQQTTWLVNVSILK